MQPDTASTGIHFQTISTKYRWYRYMQYRNWRYYSATWILLKMSKIKIKSSERVKKQKCMVSKQILLPVDVQVNKIAAHTVPIRPHQIRYPVSGNGIRQKSIGIRPVFLFFKCRIAGSFLIFQNIFFFFYMMTQLIRINIIIEH